MNVKDRVLMPRGTRAFTLIELLVVIGIIAILAMAMIPAYHSFKKRAGYVAVKNMTKQIELAILAYEDEFKEWPVSGDGGAKGHSFDAVLDELTGDNDKGIIFFEVNTNSFRTPWDAEYKFKVDHDYDNKIDGLRRRVIVWTYQDDDEEIEIRSWE